LTTGTHSVLVIGAGVGGLSAAVDLARRGVAVTVVERAAAPGGKMREVVANGVAIDAGPTVFTMRWIFEELFDAAGSSLSSALHLHSAAVLARHAWRSGGQLDLFASIDQSADAIGAFAGAAEARGFRDFCARSAAVYRTLKDSFIAAQRPSPFELVSRVGWSRIGDLWRTAPMQSLWPALARYFRDPRLQQLFGRYATYCGSSPFAAPATLMLVAHVEQDGVWVVSGGMRRVADALQGLGERHGATYRYGAHAREIVCESGQITGVVLASGERLTADAVVFNGDAGAIANGALGATVVSATTAPARAERSLSAITWCAHAKTAGFALEHHNVFFAEDYRAEFRSIFADRRVAAAPTVYVCAQDRGPGRRLDRATAERLLVLVNAPPDGDRARLDAAAVEDVAQRASAVMASCGLQLSFTESHSVVTTPAEFAQLFPGTGGALYGRANHSAFASFARSGARSRLPGLYLAGGSVHPGPGVPMAAMSGRLAAAAVIEDLTTRARRTRL
jgi:1-hydroxycarotenoid 3,4-desaturase